jgi:hypothetical protein
MSAYRLSRRTFALGAATILSAPAFVRAQGLTKVRITQPGESLSYMAIYLSALTNVREAVSADGRMTAAASDTYQKVLLMTGHLKSPVPFDAVLTNQYLPA